MNFRNKHPLIICLILVLGPVCFAQFSSISDAVSGSESSLHDVLDVVAPVSGGWGSTADLNAGAGGRRVDDNSDQVWNGTVKVTALTSFWGGTAAPSDRAGQYLRYAAPDGSDPVALAGVDSPGDSATISQGAFVLGDGGGSFGAWSSEGLNSGPIADRAVTFDVTGLDVYAWEAGDRANALTSLQLSSLQSPAYIVAFEAGSDGDYQDMVFLVQSVNPVPAPGAILLSGTGLLFTGWLRRKRLFC